jgi:hypothetical protein
VGLLAGVGERWRGGRVGGLLRGCGTVLEPSDGGAAGGRSTDGGRRSARGCSGGPVEPEDTERGEGPLACRRCGRRQRSGQRMTWCGSPCRGRWASGGWRVRVGRRGAYRGSGAGVDGACGRGGGARGSTTCRGTIRPGVAGRQRPSLGCSAPIPPPSDTPPSPNHTMFPQLKPHIHRLPGHTICGTRASVPP